MELKELIRLNSNLSLEELINWEKQQTPIVNVNVFSYVHFESIYGEELHNCWQIRSQEIVISQLIDLEIVYVLKFALIHRVVQLDFER